ncbi:MAG: DSBA oxidoreductase [Paracoccaceae bacterium]|nr:MAG: DSBA oxidoreductase [Paracoccaceae bacterium]
MIGRIFGIAALAGLMAGIPAAAEEIAPGLERDAFRAEVRAYLLENPEVILEAIRILEQRRKLAEATAELDLVRAHAEELRNDGYSHVAGNPDGSLTVVEFFDYRCGYCKRAHPDVKTLIRTNPDIRFVMKEFPILGPESLTAARAAMAALRQGGKIYEDFSDRLMSFGGALTDAVIDRLAERSGVDVARMRADMDSPEITAELERTRKLAEALRIGGTPTFVIGDKIVRGFVPLDEMTRVVELARRAQD